MSPQVFNRGHPTGLFEETQYEGKVVLVDAERNIVVKGFKCRIRFIVQFDGVPKSGENLGFLEKRRYGVCLTRYKHSLRVFAETRHKRWNEG